MRPGKIAALAAAGVALLAGAAGLGRGYQALCAGPVNTYPVLAAAQELASSEAQAAAPASPAAELARVQSGVLGALIAVKQSDYVSFPAHVAAGLALEVGDCPATSSADQWRKAAGHAWAEWPAQIAAAGLARTADKAGGAGETVAALRSYAASEPWHAVNLERVIGLTRTGGEVNG